MVFIICMLVFRWAGSNSWNSINGFNSEAKKYRCERKFHLEKNGVNESKYLTQKMNYFQRKWHSEVGKKLSVNLCITWTFLWLQLGFCFTAEMQQRHNTVLFWKQNNLFQCFLHFRNICAQHIPRPQAWGKNMRQRGERLANSMELDKGWHHWSMSTSLSINLCLESVTFCNSGKGWHRWSQSQCQLLSVVLAKRPWCLRSASFAQNHDNRDQNIDDCNDEDGYQPVWWCWKLWH